MNLHHPRTIGTLFACLSLAGCGQHGAAPDAGATPSVAVTTAMPTRRDFSTSIDAIGAVIADPRHARDLSLLHGGEVVKVDVSDGQAVRAGQTLLEVTTDPATRNAYVQAQSALTLARGELARDKQLASQHLATKSQLAAAQKAVVNARATLAAQRRIGGAAALDRVSAPADGVVTGVHVARGQRVAPNTPLASFAPAHGLIAQLGVLPDQAAQLKPGMPVVLHAVYGTLPDARGKLSMVGRAIDPQTHLVRLQAIIPDAMAAQLVTGDALAAKIHTAKFAAWAIPRQALRHDGEGDFLFQLDHGKARRVNVSIRSPAGNHVGVDGKIDPKRPVIVLGAYELSDGMAVREQAK